MTLRPERFYCQRLHWGYILKYVFAIACLLASFASISETVWCRKFNVGCPTPEENAKKMSNCQMLANQTYQNAISEAFTNPQVWKLGGFESAQDYASARKKSMLSICMTKT
jgi:hypothetical protein